STRFDAAEAIALARSSVIGVSIHGQLAAGETVCVGGGNAVLRRAASEALSASGFKNEEPCEYLPGVSRRNIVNRPLNKGLQVEVSVELIEALLKNTEKLERFAYALKSAVRKSSV
ncbi:MAG: poly-gamma-glutamate hydrolase family protein, partial [bacterium]